MIGMRKTVKGSFDDVLGRIPEALKTEGFGILTRIDVKSTLKEKLGADFRRYQILGACNPSYAHKALGVDLAIGAMLPCSVAVWEEDDGRVTVNAIDPMQTIGASDRRFEQVAQEVRAKLVRALERLG
ncbi:MAG TPA: DUF302 domain-containing protein [Anaeromyxobacteraceae bacterium]|nr:DUF302 domain-containing protein [Anaeromyxobacteraceae bacterium]